MVRIFQGVGWPSFSENIGQLEHLPQKKWMNITLLRKPRVFFCNQLLINHQLSAEKKKSTNLLEGVEIRTCHKQVTYDASLLTNIAISKTWMFGTSVTWNSPRKNLLGYPSQDSQAAISKGVGFATHILSPSHWLPIIDLLNSLNPHAKQNQVFSLIIRIANKIQVYHLKPLNLLKRCHSTWDTICKCIHLHMYIRVSFKEKQGTYPTSLHNYEGRSHAT